MRLEFTRFRQRGLCRCDFHRCDRRRSAFTMVELLVVVLLLSILGGLVANAMFGAMESARVSRTRAQIARLDTLVRELYASYLDRRVPVPIVAGRAAAAKGRVDLLREFLRMELPDRRNDVETPRVKLPHDPALWLAYKRAVRSSEVSSGWSDEYQGAECLYMIIAIATDRNHKALEFFRDSEIGDVDYDGMREILDAWGTPIAFLRWPAGFASEIQNRDPNEFPDPFDPRGIYPNNYALYPLIMSAGPDKDLDIFGVDEPTQLNYALTTPPNDPFNDLNFGMPFENDPDTKGTHYDNLHNHAFRTRSR